VSAGLAKGDGYTPITAYLGNEGWCMGLELRPGTQHSDLETHFFLDRVLPRVHALVGQDQLTSFFPAGDRIHPCRRSGSWATIGPLIW
jgi:hypothetical protein